MLMNDFYKRMKEIGEERSGMYNKEEYGKLLKFLLSHLAQGTNQASEQIDSYVNVLYESKLECLPYEQLDGKTVIKFNITDEVKGPEFQEVLKALNVSVKDILENADGTITFNVTTTISTEDILEATFKDAYDEIVDVDEFTVKSRNKGGDFSINCDKAIFLDIGDGYEYSEELPLDPSDKHATLQSLVPMIGNGLLFIDHDNYTSDMSPYDYSCDFEYDGDKYKAEDCLVVFRPYSARSRNSDVLTENKGVLLGTSLIEDLISLATIDEYANTFVEYNNATGSNFDDGETGLIYPSTDAGAVAVFIKKKTVVPEPVRDELAAKQTIVEDIKTAYNDGLDG